MRRVLLLAVVVLLVPAGAARADCAKGASEDHQGQAAVTVDGGGSLGDNWKPCDITISAGTKVSFSFAAGFHTSESDPGQAEHWNFKSPGAHAFRYSGTFTYFCAFHKDVGMIGRVTVIGGLPPPPNRAPTAKFSAKPSSAFAGDAVTLDASKSSDPDGDALSYRWTIGGKTVTKSTPTLTHVFTAPGDPAVRLQVTDPKGARSAVVSHVVHVKRRPFPGAALSGKTAKVSAAGRLRVKVACPKTAAKSCAGRVSLTRAGRRIATATFAKVRAGRTKRVTLRLTKAARRALKLHGHLAVKVRVSTRSPAHRTRTGKLKLVSSAA